MSNLKYISGGVTAAKGFLASGIHCGIRKNKSKKDLALIFSKIECDAAAVYTLNKVKGSPIIITKKNLTNGKAKAVICNSGNANTCNADGELKAQMMCDLLAEKLQILPNDVIVASTGVIGQVLPIEPIRDGINELVNSLSNNGSSGAEQAIMTTDTREKEVAVEFEIDGTICRIGGIAKGSGMIHPNMATMLGFLTTDVAIDYTLLQEALLASTQKTFNMVSVDGDTSTNDMVSIMASGVAGNKRIVANGKDFDDFCEALSEVNRYLSREIARDGEGATKLLECNVSKAKDTKIASIVAKSVITSSLLKAAMFGEDANWGRVLCAVGYAGCELDVSLVDVSFESVNGNIAVCKSGAGIDFNEELAAKVLSADEIKINICLNSGESVATAWGCDLTYDYVKINGDYRT
jgi:glutamate N-acetyltransferase/amino-acid N-acetyltransferase